MDKLKQILQTDFINHFFHKTHLPQLLTNVTTKLTANSITLEHCIIAETLASHLHLSKKESKYFINTNKIQVKNKNNIIKHLTTITVIQEDILTTQELTDLDDLINNQSPKTVKLMNTTNTTNITYKFPTETPYQLIKYTGSEYAPFNSPPDDQDDDLNDINIAKAAKSYHRLRNLPTHEQKSPEWFEVRNKAITASDSATILGENPYEMPFKFILKKTIKEPFKSNKFCHHGTKFERIANLIYMGRKNVHLEEFGLIIHQKYNFLGCSPDSICSPYKLDKIHKTKHIGLMLETKCPLVRKIKSDGEIHGDICPRYYYCQVLTQLEVCDLDECDFWQCNIAEYSSRTEFIADTSQKEPFRSAETNFEKGCIIQLIPKNKTQDAFVPDKYLDTIYDNSAYIYPSSVRMTPYQCDMWIAETLGDLANNPKYKNYIFDKVIYWKLRNSCCVTIKRDHKWFQDSLPVFDKFWKYVLFFRDPSNKFKLDILYRYIKAFNLIETKSMVKNNEVMDLVSKIYNTKAPDYDKFILETQKLVEKKEVDVVEKNNKKLESETNVIGYSVDSDDDNNNTANVVKPVYNSAKTTKYVKTNKYVKPESTVYCYADNSD